ncbi:non-ribosomal peptide synthetase [Streptomyces varsoviensis]|uniref:non-ribosomal peptide synthetase n=1 Tax=Streptomyces varsoviensis TaxID=67373 RepID=UPI0033CDEB59
MTETTMTTEAVPGLRDGGAAPSVLRGGPLPAAPAAGETVLSWYETWVRETPDAPAVADGEHRWTYAELDAAAVAVADTLRGRVGPGDIVAVCLDRSAALVAVAVALARLGAVYLPLGPRPGERRLAAVAEGLRVVAVVGAPELLPPAHRAAEHLPLPVPEEGVNAVAGAVAAFRPPAAGARTAPDGTFYAVLTSGSTGTPKAVAVGQRSLGALLRWHRERTGLRAGDRHSLHVGVAFDPHLLELWSALTCGATLSVAPDEVRWDPGALADWWREAGITVAVSSTPMVEPLLDRPWPAGLKVRHIYVGGDRLRRRPGPDVTATIHNAYGPAEATVVCTAYAMRGEPADGAANGGAEGHGGTADDGAAGEPPAIGRPVAGAVVCVADERGRVVPQGEAGELLVGGDCLSLGYLDEELTARRFVAAPDALTGVERVYRTGDRVRLRADGELEFLGRLDDQVKVSGVRVEPAEVEAAFEHDARVRRAVVAVRRPASGGVRLVAFVLPAPGASPAARDLLGGVRAWLPEQAVPSEVHLVDGYPLDANGKVDRAALLDAAESATEAAKATEATDGPAAEGPAAADSGTARGLDDLAGSASEVLVLRLCRDLLATPAITLDDNFTEAGGQSLTAARLLAAIQDAVGVRLRAPEVLRQPDLRAVAALVDKRLAAAAEVS